MMPLEASDRVGDRDARAEPSKAIPPTNFLTTKFDTAGDDAVQEADRQTTSRPDAAEMTARP